MRLELHEITAIRRSASLAFGEDVTVRVFGSRAFDERRGGDIDLHVEVSRETDEIAARARFFDSLFGRIDEQRVDLVVHRRGEPLRGIDMIARRDGVEL
ncbi:MAG: nucleotidyltransferase domain-containing protein [Janthinobacterium lividum]